jgi:hypothetical protein
MRKIQMLRRICVASLFAVLLLACLAGLVTAEGSNWVKERGTLSSIEADGTVIINGGGYNVSPSVRIRDSFGKRVLLNELQLPTEIYFEYEYSPQGPVIKVIQEMAK